MFEFVAGVKRGDEDLARFVRWSLFDKGGAAKALACWLDRRTGRLLYQPASMDPNMPAAMAPAGI